MAKKIWGQISAVLAVLGFVSAASSLISLIQHIGGITLVGVFDMYVKTYRDIMHPVIAFLPNLFGLRAPTTLKDAWTLSAIFIAVYFRTHLLFGTEYWSKKLGRKVSSLAFAHTFPEVGIVFIIGTYSLLGIVLFGLCCWMALTLKPKIVRGVDVRVGQRAFLRRYSYLLVISVVASAVFFALNGFLGQAG